MVHLTPASLHASRPIILASSRNRATKLRKKKTKSNSTRHAPRPITDEMEAMYLRLHESQRKSSGTRYLRPEHSTNAPLHGVPRVHAGRSGVCASAVAGRLAALAGGRSSRQISAGDGDELLLACQVPTKGAAGASLPSGDFSQLGH